MTHLDNEGEAGLCFCGLCRVGMGLWRRGLSIPLSLPQNQAGRGMDSQNKGNLSPLNPMLCPPLLATLLPTLPDCWARCFPAQPALLCGLARAQGQVLPAAGASLLAAEQAGAGGAGRAAL